MFVVLRGFCVATLVQVLRTSDYTALTNGGTASCGACIRASPVAAAKGNMRAVWFHCTLQTDNFAVSDGVLSCPRLKLKSIDAARFWAVLPEQDRVRQRKRDFYHTAVLAMPVTASLSMAC